MKKYFVHSLVLIALITILDRITKIYALSHCAIEQRVTSFLSCALTFNRGISWGMLHHANGYVFVLVTAFIAAITAYIAYLGWQRIQAGEWAMGYMLVVIGSISNIIDRIVYGAVVDFIAFTLFGWNAPVFNVADVCIVVGVLWVAVSVSQFFEANDT
jgi:signal peptidase II